MVADSISVSPTASFAVVVGVDAAVVEVDAVVVAAVCRHPSLASGRRPTSSPASVSLPVMKASAGRSISSPSSLLVAGQEGPLDRLPPPQLQLLALSASPAPSSSTVATFF